MVTRDPHLSPVGPYAISTSSHELAKMHYFSSNQNVHRREKTCLQGFQSGPTQTGWAVQIQKMTRGLKVWI